MDPAYLTNVLSDILDDLYDCLGENTVAGAPVDKFPYHTRPPDDCCDYLSIYVIEMLPTVDFPNVDRSAQRCGNTQRMVRCGLKLRRPCWPVLKDSAFSPFPNAPEIVTATDSLNVDGEVMWCCLAGGFLSGDSTASSGTCNAALIERLVPDKPEGGCAGWTAHILVELDGCC